jgi:hypothetical protein
MKHIHVQTPPEPFRDDMGRFLIKLTIGGVGLLIGASIALYWAVNQIQPLTPTNVIYVNER